MMNDAGILVSDVQPSQIMTFGDRTKIISGFKWRYVLRVVPKKKGVRVYSLWHFPKTVPADTRVWLWQS